MTLHELNKAMAEVEEIASETARLDEEQRLREYEVTIIEIARIACIVIPDKLCDIMDIDWPELLKVQRHLIELTDHDDDERSLWHRKVIEETEKQRIDGRPPKFNKGY